MIEAKTRRSRSGLEPRRACNKQHAIPRKPITQLQITLAPNQQMHQHRYLRSKLNSNDCNPSKRPLKKCREKTNGKSMWVIPRIKSLIAQESLNTAIDQQEIR